MTARDALHRQVFGHDLLADRDLLQPADPDRGAEFRRIPHDVRARLPIFILLRPALRAHVRPWKVYKCITGPEDQSVGKLLAEKVGNRRTSPIAVFREARKELSRVLIFSLSIDLWFTPEQRRRIPVDN